MLVCISSNPWQFKKCHSTPSWGALMPYTKFIDSKRHMLWQDRNGTWHSTLSGPEMLALGKTNTDDFIENTKLVAEKTGNLDLWKEMFGEDN